MQCLVYRVTGPLLVYRVTGPLYFFRFLKFIGVSGCIVSSIPKTKILEDDVILRRGFTSEKVKELRVTSLAPHLNFSQNESKNVDVSFNSEFVSCV